MGSDSLHLNTSAVLCLPFPAALAPLRSVLPGNDGSACATIGFVSFNMTV